MAEYLTKDGLQSIDLVLRPPAPLQRQQAGDLRRTQQVQQTQQAQQTISTTSQGATISAASHPTSAVTTISSNSSSSRDSVREGAAASAPVHPASTAAVHAAEDTSARLAEVSLAEDGCPTVSPPTPSTATLATDPALQWEPPPAPSAPDDRSRSALGEVQLSRRPEFHKVSPCILIGPFSCTQHTHTTTILIRTTSTSASH